MSQNPEVFGMDDNVDISKELQETKELFDSILVTQSQHSGGSSGKTVDETLNEISADILSKVNSLFSFSLTLPACFEKHANLGPGCVYTYIDCYWWDSVKLAEGCLMVPECVSSACCAKPSGPFLNFPSPLLPPAPSGVRPGAGDEALSGQLRREHEHRTGPGDGEIQQTYFRHYNLSLQPAEGTQSQSGTFTLSQ